MPFVTRQDDHYNSVRIMRRKRTSEQNMIGWQQKVEQVLIRLGSACLLLLLSVSVALAQTTCPALVEQAMNTVNETCASMGRNQVCYGNTSIDAEFATADVNFALPGDRASVLDLQ